MHAQTNKLVEELKKAEWFSALGNKLTTDVRVLSSWKEGVKQCKSKAWQGFRIEIGNRLRERIDAVSPLDLDGWNDLVTELRAIIDPIVETRTAELCKEMKLPMVFVYSVQADLLMAMLEQEYSAIVAPDAGTMLARWYLKGRFPCGWEGGEYPKGRLIVY